MRIVYGVPLQCPYLDFDAVVSWVDSIALSVRFYRTPQLSFAMHVIEF